MDDHEIKDRIHAEIIAKQFPDLGDVDPVIESGPSESQLRRLRRTRGVLTANEIDAIPLECRVIYQRHANDEYPFDRTVMVVTDDEGTPQVIVESK